MKEAVSIKFITKHPSCNLLQIEYVVDSKLSIYYLVTKFNQLS